MMAVRVKRRPYGGQARFYDAEYRDYVDDVALYADWLREERIREGVLELGCGTGRVTFPLAELGFGVTGLDNSRPMLRRAWQRRAALAPESAVRVRFSLQDMVDFHFRARFRAALVPFSTFAMLLRHEDRAACLARCHAQLAQGGVLYIDLFAPRVAPEPAAVELRPRASRSFRLPPFGHLVERLTHERQSESGEHDEVEYHYLLRDAVDERIIDELHVSFSLARLSQAYMETLLDAAGFLVESVHGDYRGNPFGPASDRMIFRTRR